MLKSISAVFVLVSVFGANPARALEPFGVWKTEDGESKINLAPCGTKLCGTLIWLSAPNDAAGQPLRDVNNISSALRNRPLIGVQLLLGLAKDGDHWVGKIYNPDDGKTYDGSLTLSGTDKAAIKGCVAAIFCQSDILIRQ